MAADDNEPMSADPQPELLLTVPEAASQVRFPARQLYRALRAHELVGRRLGGTWMISPAALAAWLSTLVDQLPFF